MEQDQDDLAELAALLDVDADRLRAATGRPWTVMSGRSAEMGGASSSVRPLFIGGPGPSVAISLSPQGVIVGPAVGHWDGPAELVWQVGEPRATVPIPSTASDEARFFERLGEAVEAAARTKAPTLVRCRHCGVQVAPELAFDSETCQSCATAVLGVVF